MGPASSTASYQLSKMVAAGALTEQRVGLRKVYAAAIDPIRAREHQYASYLLQTGNKALATVLSKGPMRVPEIRESLSRGKASIQGLQKRLARLVGLALVHVDLNGGSVLAVRHAAHVGVSESVAKDT